jgi:hypothetical protein
MYRHAHVATAENFRIVAEPERHARRRLRDGLVNLANVERCDLVEGGALYNALSDLAVLARGGDGIPESTFAQAISGAERVLEQVVLSETNEKRYTFVQDHPPLDDEYELLHAAFELDGELYQDETFCVQDLVTVTRMDAGRVRRVLCLWLDDAIAYIARAQLDPDSDREPIALLEKAKRRLETWDRYRAGRERMKRFIITLRVSPPYPPDHINLIRSIALGSSVHLTDDVLPDPQGFKVQGVYPDDWDEDQIAGFSRKLEEEVKRGFADVLARHAPAPEAGTPATILYITANGVDHDLLALEEEVREVELKIQMSEHRESLRLRPRLAARPDDLIHALNADLPTVVHFSGHGGKRGIVFQGDDGAPRRVPASALKRVFTTFKDNIRVVVLNSCHSTDQAAAIVDCVDCVIAMNDSIDDETARRFAASFYRALGFGRSVQHAFNQAVTSVAMEGLPDEDVPVLMVRTGVDANQVLVVSPPKK